MAARIDLRKDVSLTGVAVGGLADIVLTNLALLPVMVWYAADPEVQALPQDQVTEHLTRIFLEDPQLYVLGLALGSAASIGGGYLAARIAKRSEVLNGALSSYLCLAFGIYGFVANPAGLGPLEHVAFLILSPALGAFGGTLAARRARAYPVVRSSDDPFTDSNPQSQRLYHSMPAWKLVLLCVTSFGFYEIYWSYRQWTHVASRETSRKIRPIWRGIFAIFFAGPLLRRIRDDCRTNAIHVSYRPYLLAVLYVALHFAVRLPDPYWLLGLVASLALVPGQNAANVLSKTAGGAPSANARLRKWEWAVVIAGGTFLVLVVIGTFLPEIPPSDPPPGLT